MASATIWNWVSNPFLSKGAETSLVVHLPPSKSSSPFCFPAFMFWKNFGMSPTDIYASLDALSTLKFKPTASRKPGAPGNTTLSATTVSCFGRTDRNPRESLRTIIENIRFEILVISLKIRKKRQSRNGT